MRYRTHRRTVIPCIHLLQYCDGSTCYHTRASTEMQVCDSVHIPAPVLRCGYGATDFRLSDFFPDPSSKGLQYPLRYCPMHLLCRLRY
eukprot:2864301-Rhodomonas_salina.2